MLNMLRIIHGVEAITNLAAQDINAMVDTFVIQCIDVLLHQHQLPNQQTLLNLLAQAVLLAPQDQLAQLPHHHQVPHVQMCQKAANQKAVVQI